MWGKNSSRTLARVLARIDQVIPKNVIQNKIFIDDHSTDDTKEIASSFGWEIYNNEGMGIGDAANTALKHVKSPYFASFEHDLLLAFDWWDKVPKHLIKQNVIAAQGMRVADNPVLKSIDEFTIRLYRKIGEKIYIRSIDNTIFKTDKLRSLGGFPRLEGAGVDVELVRRITKAGYKWVVESRVLSTHLRGSVKNQIRHYYWYGRTDHTYTLMDIFVRFLVSPLISSVMVFVTKCPQVFYIYPLMRFMLLKGRLARHNTLMQ
jgi:glycosyltransferase involved in cell wall biosynthesis